VDRFAARIGVMLDGWTPAAWIAEALQGVQFSRIAPIVTVILHREPPPRRDSWPFLIRRVLAPSVG